jgi:hypothetical protein
MTRLAVQGPAIWWRFAQRLTVSVSYQCLDELNQVSPFTGSCGGHLMMVGLGSSRATMDLLWSRDLKLQILKSRFTGETSAGWMLLPCSLSFCSSRVTSAFVVDLYVGLLRNGRHDVDTSQTSWDLTGQAHEPFSRGESTKHPVT